MRARCRHSPRTSPSKSDPPAIGRATFNGKIELYLAHGSTLVIDVNPQTLTIALHDASAMRVLREGDRFEHVGAPGLTFDVRALFASVE
jgi:hypothetical protein